MLPSLLASCRNQTTSTMFLAASNIMHVASRSISFGFVKKPSIPFGFAASQPSPMAIRVSPLPPSFSREIFCPFTSEIPIVRVVF